MEKTDFKKVHKNLYQPSSKDFVIVDVPDFKFVMINGEGSPDEEPFGQSAQWLYSVIYPIKFIGKKRVSMDFVAPPLECLFWANDMEAFVNMKKEDWKWQLMLATPDWVDQSMFDEAVAKASKKLGNIPDSLRLEIFSEGKSVQIMHIGPYSEEAPTIERMHKDFIPANGLVPNGHHHEIYLGDPRKCAPEKLRTVIRQPVR